jgi:hypothetical protein
MRVARTLMIAAAAVGVGGFGVMTPTQADDAKAPTLTLRVGAFDSRAVALAYAQTAEEPGYAPHFNRLMDEYKKAKASGDVNEARRLETQGHREQDQLHRQVFSSGSIANILEKIKDQLPGISQQAGVDLIVSKWDIAYQIPGTQTVDITQAMVKPFHPSEKTLRVIQDLEKTPPIPLEEARKIPTRE